MAMAVALMVVAAVVSCHLMGLRLYGLTKARLGASDDARRAVGVFMSEVRSAKIIRVGEGGSASFTPVSGNDRQVGRAVQIYSTTNSANWIRYYWDPADQRVKRVRSDSAAVTVVASSVSNAMVFSAEDYSGQPLTNNVKEFVVGMNLQFYNPQYPSGGSGHLADRYQLQTRVAMRAP